MGPCSSTQITPPEAAATAVPRARGTRRVGGGGTEAFWTTPGNAKRRHGQILAKSAKAAHGDLNGHVDVYSDLDNGAGTDEIN
jgi:hypothetical protein